jgi:hypothetical protein
MLGLHPLHFHTWVQVHLNQGMPLPHSFNSFPFSCQSIGCDSKVKVAKKFVGLTKIT